MDDINNSNECIVTLNTIDILSHSSRGGHPRSRAAC